MFFTLYLQFAKSGSAFLLALNSRKKDPRDIDSYDRALIPVKNASVRVSQNGKKAGVFRKVIFSRKIFLAGKNHEE